MRELAFAVIGTGFWAEFQMAAWGEVPNARLVAVCDRDVEKAAAAAKRFGVPLVFSDAEEMLRSTRLDFVDVTVGPEAHEQLVLLAARHKLPVICQKPMALDYAACERMVQACREAGSALFVHENYRWQTPMRRVKQVLDSGRIGRPVRAHIQFSLGDLRFFERQPYLFEQRHFAMFDMGPHLFDLARFFFGEPSQVYAQEFKVQPRFAGEDVVCAVLRYDRLWCHCELSWRTTDHQVFIEGDEGSITWSTDRRLSVRTSTTEATESLTPEACAWAHPDYGFAHPSIVLTNRNLLAAIAGEGTAETTGEDNLKTMRLIHLAVESAKRKEALSV
ncbi:MAG: Gfo/Idh/MocA family oxidoreductase [Planctomycetes bacterium]|nr:Gfo/Idh/MocA family oxidoreductase [Planctomycetota bacterium]